jgi:probable phosphoglycerate mutase
LLVTHGGTARALIGALLGLPVASWTGIGGLSNACWSVLEYHIGMQRWILVEHNAAALPEPLYSNET